MAAPLDQNDVVIIGGGPAGISAAIWCADLGLKALLIERSPVLGGQLHLIHNPVKNYPGINAANGAEIARSFQRSVESFGFERSLGDGVSTVDIAASTVTLDGGRVHSFRRLIFAAGVSRRRLGIPGESEFAGKGVISSGVGERSQTEGKDVVIIGGGDAAIENASLLAQTAKSVTVIHRSSDFRARAKFLSDARDDPKVSFITDTTPTAIVGGERVEGVEYLDRLTGEKGFKLADIVLVRIGVKPNSEMLAGQVLTDDSGYIAVDGVCRTSVGSVFAIGDVAAPVSPTIATAVGMGAAAAKAIREELK